MRKTITGSEAPQRESAHIQGDWLALDDIATVEVTSEDPRFPIEDALRGGDGSGWRASKSGEQRIRLVFDQPISIRQIRLSFGETETERTQEFVIRSAAVTSDKAVEVVRQRWNFSPSGSTNETEVYSVDLKMTSVLELVITPDVGRPDRIASLASLRLK